MRQRFYADARMFGDQADVTRRIAAGYMCLAAAFGWAARFFIILAVNPGQIETHVLSAINFTISVYGFLQIRRRRDPRAVLEWAILLFLVSMAAQSFRHAGIVAPVTASLPVLAGVGALYMRPPMRKVAIMVGAIAIVISLLSAINVIGLPTTYSLQSNALMTFATMIFATIGLAGVAWVANIARDYSVEQLKQANEAIVENAARSRVALESARVGLWEVPDADLQKFQVSESFQTVTGYTAAEFDNIFGGNIDQFVHAEDIVPLREAFALGRKRYSRLRVDFRLKTKTRGYRWFSARARYSRNDDGTTRISGSLQDINFIKAAEEALKAGRDQERDANKAKSDFIAMMSHEVRTPLNAILGSVEVLKRRDHDTETAELIGLIDDAGRGLLTIVSDLLDVSKIEAGKLEIQHTPTDLCATVKRTVDVWRPQAGDKGLALTVDCSEADAGLLLTDAGRVRQIVGNLLSNAIKFTDTGSVAVTLSTHETREGRVEVTVSVIDTGPGVPDAIAETIFAPFEQAPSNASRGGTGLGLFISRRLARLMEGDLTLEPARRNGAHFRLTMLVDRAGQESAASDETPDEPLWAGRKVLCVDDNENNLRIAKLLLSRFGIEITVCASGAEAIDICAMDAFDVMLMDIVMPEMDGMETLKRLRGDASCPNRRTPAIALTAKLSAEDIARYAAAGFDGVAGKPINVRELAYVISPFMAKTTS